MKLNYPSLKNLASFLFVFIFLSIPDLHAQNNSSTVSGKVTDENGKALPGVTVIVKGSNITTTTKEDGTYTIPVTSRKGSLVFSSVGYEPQEISIGNKEIINLSLGISQKSLQDVVVIGYGTQKRKDVTGAVSSFDARKLDERPIERIDQALVGQMAGVNVFCLDQASV